jgi:hypothetical protein
MARVAAQRAAHQDQRLAAPAAGGRRRRIVAERIVPEQFVGPVVAVVGEHAVGREGLLAVAHLAGVLDQVKAVEIHPRDHMRGRRPAGGPAGGIDHFFAGPFARKHLKLAVFIQRCRCGETVSHR